MSRPTREEWARAFAAAMAWVQWSARRRWPAHTVNDQIWAASVADWECGGRPNS
jgi:hypothetical protein